MRVSRGGERERQIAFGKVKDSGYRVGCVFLDMAFTKTVAASLPLASGRCVGLV